ncbi:hypothetical protein [Hymenobacter sp. APR13]|uniref:hypothetical protein n=1 Tax=Hymenobacter sp. APR13 TaxID=1356852 RepID=UPI0018CF05D0|nr:hypothetical protein [Hymenobacter sp. APR13]
MDNFVLGRELQSSRYYLSISYLFCYRMSNLLYYERNLPHRLPPGSDIFLTFRLADSLPAATIARLRAQFLTGENHLPEATYAGQRRYFGRFDQLLDEAAHGATWLRHPEIANLVGGSLRHFNGIAYYLRCYCIMPNHVHLAVSLEDGAPALAETLQRIKGYTALQANKHLGAPASSGSAKPTTTSCAAATRCSA